MITLESVSVLNVYKKTFENSKGEEIEYYRSLLNVPGEAPMELAVKKGDFEMLSGKIGVVGSAVVELDAQPGNRTKVYFRDIA